MSVDPAATAVTSPPPETDAMAASVDCHAVWAVTSCVEPFESDAVAVNCAVSVGISEPADPAICRDVTVVVGVGVVGGAAEDAEPPLPPQLTSTAATAISQMDRIARGLQGRR
jgi:hypothetical protein